MNTAGRESGYSGFFNGVAIKPLLDNLSFPLPAVQLSPNSSSNTPRNLLPSFESFASMQPCAPLNQNVVGFGSPAAPAPPLVVDQGADPALEPSQNRNSSTANPTSGSSSPIDSSSDQSENELPRKFGRSELQNHIWTSLKDIKELHQRPALEESSLEDPRRESIKRALERLKKFILGIHHISGVSLGEELLWEFMSSSEGRELYGNDARRDIDEDEDWHSIGKNVKKMWESRKSSWAKVKGRNKFLSHGIQSNEYFRAVTALERYVSYTQALRLVNRNVFQRLQRAKRINGGISKEEYVFTPGDVTPVVEDIQNMIFDSPPRPSSSGKDLDQNELATINAMLDGDLFLVGVSAHPVSISTSVTHNPIFPENTPEHTSITTRDNTTLHNTTAGAPLNTSLEPGLEANGPTSASGQLQQENRIHQTQAAIVQTKCQSASDNLVIPADEGDDCVILGFAQTFENDLRDPQFQRTEQEGLNRDTFVDREPDIREYVNEDMLDDVPETNDISDDIQPVNDREPFPTLLPAAVTPQIIDELLEEQEHQEEMSESSEITRSTTPDEPPFISAMGLNRKLRFKEIVRMGSVFRQILDDLGIVVTSEERNKYFKDNFAKEHGYVIVAPEEIFLHRNSKLIDWPNERWGMLLPMLKDKIIKVIKPGKGKRTKFKVPEFSIDVYITKAHEDKDGWEDEFGPKPTLEDIRAEIKAEFFAKEALKRITQSSASPVPDDAERDLTHEAEEAVAPENSQPEENQNIEATKPLRPQRAIKKTQRACENESRQGGGAKRAHEESPAKRQTSGPTTRSSCLQPQETRPRATKQTRQPTISSTTRSQTREFEQVTKDTVEQIITRRTQTPSTSSIVQLTSARALLSPASSTTSVGPICTRVSTTTTAAVPPRADTTISLSTPARRASAATATPPPAGPPPPLPPRSAKAIVTKITAQMATIQSKMATTTNSKVKQMLERPLAELTNRKRNWSEFAQAEEEIESLDVDPALLDMMREEMEKMIDNEVKEKGIFSQPERT